MKKTNNLRGENMKTITETKLTKILINLIPSYFDDIKKPNIKVQPATFGGATIEKQITFDWYTDKKVWFYFWKKEDGRFHVSMDGAISYDYLSTDSEFFCNRLNSAFIKSFEDIGLYPHPNNHYSFTVGERA
jgi:hypothetical protein|tara:strand:- start:610 stop:1005 length:396 start_codon:yes stop_codon:yes gene_type:complete